MLVLTCCYVQLTVRINSTIELFLLGERESDRESDREIEIKKIHNLIDLYYLILPIPSFTSVPPVIS